MLVSHYSPTAKVVLEKNYDEALSRARQLEQTGSKVIIIDESNEAILARELYRHLRDADSQGFSHVVVIEPQGDGLSVAIRDRLRKASA
jgi:predicted kinase